MAYIDKLIKKFNKIQGSINSLKGVAAKIQAINYNTAIDQLADQVEEAENRINKRRNSLKKSLSGVALANSDAKQAPKMAERGLVYPYHDELANYLVFEIRPRLDSPDTRINIGDEEDKFTMPDEIALYIPDTLISQAAVQYSEEGIGTFQRAISKIADAFGSGDLLGTMKDQGAKVGKEFAINMLNELSGGLTNLKQGRASNPQKELLLQGLGFRTWDFTFDFLPRSAEEANQVKEIITTFRYAMLPAVTKGKIFADDKSKTKAEANGLDTDEEGNFFDYPNVFDISFSGPLGDQIDGFLPSVCTNAQVDHTGGQKFSAYEDGVPIKTTLTLQFQEIRILHQQNYNAVRAGGSGRLLKDSLRDTETDLVPDPNG